MTTDYGYDLAGRLTSVVHGGGGVGSTQSYQYTLDDAGNRTAVAMAGGTESYTLDAVNRLTNVTYANSDTAAYTYDANGNRLTETINGVQTHAYSYDDADQLTSDGSIAFSYDSAGNLTQAGIDTFAWDWTNQLTSATVNGSTATFAYDGDGSRTSQTSNSATTDYLWDRESGLPLLIDDGTNAYLHAGGVQSNIDSGNAATYPLSDALGSVRAGTDSSGAVVGTHDFDVFGETRASSGTTGTFGFTGEQSDSTTGLTYLRARYASPALGRFISADSVQPNAPGTQGYTRYTYAANNPTTWTDPSGRAIEDAMLMVPLFAGLTSGIAYAGLLCQMTLSSVGNGPIGTAIGAACSLRFLQIAVAIIMMFSVLLYILAEPWIYYPDGMLPGIPAPVLANPAAVRAALENFPNVPDKCVQGALSGIVQELAWGVVAGAAVGFVVGGGIGLGIGLADLGIAAFVGCMTSGNGGSGGSSWVDDILTTEHGRKNLLERKWTRADYDAVKQGGAATTQYADDALVYLRKVGTNKYNVLIESAEGAVVSAMPKGLSKQEVRSLAKNYDWGIGWWSQ